MMSREACDVTAVEPMGIGGGRSTRITWSAAPQLGAATAGGG